MADGTGSLPVSERARTGYLVGNRMYLLYLRKVNVEHRRRPQEDSNDLMTHFWKMKGRNNGYYLPGIRKVDRIIM